MEGIRPRMPMNTPVGEAPGKALRAPRFEQDE
jgi:hypothetical protein